MGDPCAGQERENGRKEGIVRVELLESAENLGEEPPTGSKNEWVVTGLCVGTGAPWAGQDREKGRASAIDGGNVRAGNFGADPPTGSKGGF